MKLNQVWNIFRKDARHHWIEITVSVALLACLAWMDLSEWIHLDAGYMRAFDLNLLSTIVPPLVPLSWMFLIVRVVHGESLAGDRQFWVTRPYDWKQLLAAKILFILAFINVPLFLADAFLLAKAGFSPWAYLIPLLWLQLTWILLLFLPIAALAAVTRTIPQMLLALLLVVLFVIGLAMLAQTIPNSSFAFDTANVFFLLILVTSVAAVLLQYSRRRTTQSRLFFAGLGIASVLVLVATPYRSLIAHRYPLVNSTNSPLQLTLLPLDSTRHDMYSGGSQISVHFRFQTSGLAPGSFAQINGRMLALTNAQGAWWDSGWEDANMLIFPNQNSVNIDVPMKRGEYDRLKSGPLNAHLLLAYTLYHQKNQREFITTAGEFLLPDFGYCASHASWASLTCRTPLRTPDLIVTLEMASSTCPLGPNDHRYDPGEMTRQFIPAEYPVDFGISSVGVKQLSLYQWSNSERGSLGICPGTPLDLSTPEEAGKSRLELQFDNFTLPDYELGPGNTIHSVFLKH